MTGSQQLILGEGAGGAVAANYIEDVFSTWLYSGGGGAISITNGIDLSTKGGLVWLKMRNDSVAHRLVDTARGATKFLASDSTGAQGTETDGLTAFNTNGFSLGTNVYYNGNFSGYNYASWTFRKQPKFFDVVTYTGNGTNRTIAHNLGSVPGCIIVKRTDTAADWQVYHRSLANTEYIVLNSTAAKATGTTRWNSTTPTSTVFSLGTDTTVNANGGTYVAYLFAHDAGGFGLTGADNVITCGSYTENSGTTIELGYEPQWVMTKDTTGGSPMGGGSWKIVDSMRSFTVQNPSTNNLLFADSIVAEQGTGTASVSRTLAPTATGFRLIGGGGGTVIYIAIRRGPMKTPTTGTSVYTGVARTGTSAAATVTAGFPVDMVAVHMRSSVNNQYVADRLRGGGFSLEFSRTTEEQDRSSGGITSLASNTGFSVGTFSDVNASPQTYINWCFRRAPGFFDVVCYTGDGTANRSVSHNLGVSPELVIIKGRNAISGNADSNWSVNISTAIATDAGRPSVNYLLFLNSVTGWYNWGAPWFGTASLTSTTFPVTEGSGGATCNGSGTTYVAYLFASCPGVSKVGSYNGTGATLQINCGFTGGARFVLIKRTNSTGDWYVWDSARGIVASNDPYLLWNTNDAEVTNTDWVDTHSPGFELSNAAGNNANINGAAYIFLAIA